MRQLNAVTLYKPAYYPGCPITKECVEALITRWLGELSGFLYDGYAHISIEYEDDGEIVIAEMTDEGVWSHPAPIEPVDYVYQMIWIPCVTKQKSDHFISVTNRVSTTALIKKMFRIPLGRRELICTDLFDLFVGKEPRHLDPEELLNEVLCDLLYYVKPSEFEMICQPTSITPDVSNVVHVTTWQFILMGMVTALGAGHLIRKGHLKW